MEVALDGAHGAAQGLGQGLHLGPAQTTLVVGVIAEGTICRDRLGGDSGEDEGLYLRYPGESGLLWHRRLLFWCGGALWGDKMPQSGGLLGEKVDARRFFYALFTGAYFTYTGILALGPEEPQLSH